MPNISVFKSYWDAVLNVLACVYLYCRAEDDDDEYHIRYQLFPIMAQEARIAYYSCDRFPRANFGLLGDELDEFFSEILLDGDRLDQLCSQALDNYCFGAPAVPLRLL